MKKWFSRIAIGCGIVVLGVTIIAGVMFYRFANTSEGKTSLQMLEVPARNSSFVLMADAAGFGDPAWSVYRLPANGKLTEAMQGRSNAGALFWNYAEAGNHSENAKIEVVNGRYLVFSRGGLKHSLYDLKADTVLVNNPSPWHSFMDSENHRDANNSSPVDEKAAMDAWVRTHLEARIDSILNGAT